MPYPWVYSATIANGEITALVDVTDLYPTQKAAEITGAATQVNGAFAPIYCIVDVTKATSGNPKDPDQAGKYFVPVAATPVDGHAFDPDQDFTVFVRVSIVWVTVLGPGTDGVSEPEKEPGSYTWGRHKADSHISALAGGY